MSTSARRSARLSAPPPTSASTTATNHSTALTDVNLSNVSSPNPAKPPNKPVKTRNTTTKQRHNPPAATTTSPSQTAANPCPSSADDVLRCWKTQAPDSIAYHDERWGNTAHFFPSSLSDSESAQYRESLRRLFMMQSLELMQAGLSWSCIMGKWAGFLRAFDEFDVDKVSQYDDKDVERLMNDPGIVRNKLKILAIIQNARTILQLQQSTPHGFLHLLFQHHLPHSPHQIDSHERVLSTGRHQPSWMRTDYRTAGYKDRVVQDGVHPSVSVVELSKDMKRAGFRFMGETVVLSFMQAVGLMNHHAHDCGWYQQCEDGYERVRRMFVEEAEQRLEQQDDEKRQTGSDIEEEKAEVEAEAAKQKGSAKTNGANNGRKRSVKRQKTQVTDEREETTKENGEVDSKLEPAVVKQRSQTRGRKKRTTSAESELNAEDDEEKSSLQESEGRARRRKVVGATNRQRA